MHNLLFMKQRKIEMVAKRVSFSEAEEEDLEYWMNIPASTRVLEMVKWKKNIWTLSGDDYPTMEKVAEKISKSKVDRDEF